MTLHTHHWGTAGGPRVLLLHGVQSSGASWWRIAEGLAASGAEVTAPDLRGHGASPRASSYRFADFVGDLEPGWDLVVGHSLGGTLAAFALAQDPGFARRAVLLDPVLELPEDDFETIVEDQLEELRSADAGALQAANPRWSSEDCRHKAEAAAACSPHAAEAVLRENRPWDHAHLLEAIDTPLWILGGDPAAGALFSPSGDSRYRMLQGTGHAVHRDDPHAVLDGLREALA
jgi:pimeloyl-ACP methyl ester carboxylesterase